MCVESPETNSPSVEFHSTQNDIKSMIIGADGVLLSGNFYLQPPEMTFLTYYFWLMRTLQKHPYVALENFYFRCILYAYMTKYIPYMKTVI